MTSTIDTEIRKRLDLVRSYLERKKWEESDIAADPEVVAEAMDREEEIAPAAVDVLRTDAYHDHLLATVQEARERFQAATADDHPYDGPPRSEPLCTCADAYCDLKRGQLPPAVRSADDLDAGIRQFKQAHNGHPVILDEAQAQWDQKTARVLNGLGRILTSLTSNRPLSNLESDDSDATDTAPASAD